MEAEKGDIPCFECSCKGKRVVRGVHRRSPPYVRHQRQTISKMSIAKGNEERDVLEVLQVVVVFIFDLLDPESALCNPHIQSANRLSVEFGGTYDESTYHPPKQEREP